MENIVNFAEIVKIDGVYRLVLTTKNDDKFIIDIDIIKKIIKDEK